MASPPPAAPSARDDSQATDDSLLPPITTALPTNNRLSQPFWSSRLPTAVLLSGSLGMILGVSHGAQTTALRFRAENSHRLPTSERGWYLYHKSKNYTVMLAAAREGGRMAGKLAVWTALFFGLEEIVDRGRVGRAQVEEIEDMEHGLSRPFGRWRAGRGKRDALSTITAGLTTAGVFSAWNRLPWNTAAQTVKLGFLGGLSFGLAQDAVSLMQGKRLAYVDWTMRMVGLGAPDEVERPV